MAPTVRSATPATVKPTIPETHHAAPLTSVGGDCSVCHQSVSSPDVCANCHDASPHHYTAWAALRGL